MRRARLALDIVERGGGPPLEMSPIGEPALPGAGALLVKITDVTTHVLGTPWRDLTFVQVHTDEGLTGVGETRMLGHTQALLGYLAEATRNHVVGSDPFAIESLVQRMKYGDYGRAGEIVMSGIGVRRDGVLGHRRQGARPARSTGCSAARCNERIKAYANGWYTVERSPEEFHAAARRVIERGYRALKFDPFGEGRFELTHEERMRSVALVEAVRDAVGPEVEILVEMHGRFAPHEAIRVAGLLEPFEPAWIEEPVPPENLDGAGERSPSTRRCRSPPASASTTGSSSASCSSSQAR